MTEKRKYEKPSMEVYELKQQPKLLAGSNTGTLNNPDDYLLKDDPFGF